MGAELVPFKGLAINRADRVAIGEARRSAIELRARAAEARFRIEAGVAMASTGSVGVAELNRRIAELSHDNHELEIELRQIEKATAIAIEHLLFGFITG